MRVMLDQALLDLALSVRKDALLLRCGRVLGHEGDERLEHLEVGLEVVAHTLQLLLLAEE